MRKVPPYSVHSEKVVIGTCLRHPKFRSHAKRELRSGEAFFRQDYGQMFDKLLSMPGTTPTDSVTTMIELFRDDGSIDCLGGEKGLRELFDAAQEPADAIQHVKVVAEKARMRSLIDTVSDILHDAYHSGDDSIQVLTRAKQSLDRLKT